MLRTSTSGFTIVELMVVLITTSILAGVLFGPLDSLYNANVTSTRTIAQFGDNRNSLHTIQDKITTSTGFLATNNVPDPAGTSWNYSNSGVYNVLITGNYVTSVDAATDTSGSRALVLNSACTAGMQNNFVYFVTGTTLYRRLLVNTATPCAANGVTNGEKQTCAATNTAYYCKGDDAQIATGVTAFTVQYYANAQDTTTITDPTAASTVVLNLTTQNGTGSLLNTTTDNLRVSHIN